MRVSGGNLKGATIFPRLEKSATPKKHKYGANVTWSAHTDTYKPTLTGHGIDAEINAFKHNLQLTILISPSTDQSYEEQIRDVLQTGRLDAGIYFRTTQPIQEQVEFYYQITGRYASYWSYGNGIRDHDYFALSNSLVTRLSGAGEVGYDFNERLEHKSSSIFNYDVRDFSTSEALSRAEGFLNNAISQEGWYNDFSHWHWAEQYGDINQLEQFFSSQRALLNTTNSVTLGAGEALEYMWLRKQYKRGGLYQDESELVLISDVKNVEGLPYKTINTSLSVEVDLTGTILAGKEIESDTDILKVSGDKFIVQVPYSGSDGFKTVRLRETTNPNYMDFSLPVIQTVSKTGSLLDVTTDKPTNIVVFSVPSGGSLYQASVLARSSIMSPNHTIDVTGIDFTNFDIYVGAITKEKQSTLSVKYNL
jgi:hypothetical protein